MIASHNPRVLLISILHTQIHTHWPPLSLVRILRPVSLCSCLSSCVCASGYDRRARGRACPHVRPSIYIYLYQNVCAGPFTGPSKYCKSPIGRGPRASDTTIEYAQQYNTAQCCAAPIYMMKRQLSPARQFTGAQTKRVAQGYARLCSNEV